MDLEKIKQICRTQQGYADIRQDILALSVSGFKHGGYFVEFGVMDGIGHSNTFLLENQYGWQGIVAEPAKVFHDRIRKNRRCSFDTRAVADLSGRILSFKETDFQLGLSGLIDYFDPKEMHAGTRSNSTGAIYDVTTVSLNDLLVDHGAPQVIDYISMDTEGSEPAILNTFDFSKYRVGLWTIEHNFFETGRQTMYDIMTNHGYTRILTEMSFIDDWYVPTDSL